MSSESETLHGPLSRPEPLSRKNSPVACGLGPFGLEAVQKVFWGFYLFFYVDVLGLAVTLAARCGSSRERCGGEGLRRSQADRRLKAGRGECTPRQPITKAHSGHRLASFVHRHRRVKAGRFVFVPVPPFGDSQVDRGLPYPQPSSSGKILLYLTLLRGSAIISATVSRQVW
jgi:hypothetical protein